MKTVLLGMMCGALLVLAGCGRSGDPTTTITAAEVAQQPVVTTEPTAMPLTHTPQSEPTETAVPPANTPPPEPTETAIPPTDTPQPEPTRTAGEAIARGTSTATPLSEPTASAIPCSGVLTSPNQEGPYYSPGSPERTSLIDEGLPGVPILIIGRVFDQNCDPIAGAKLDFWLADVNGEYDNVGYTLRGHLFTDENGNYALESIEPTPYTGRPPHVHAKVFAPDGRELLTTQMYFSGSEGSSDVTALPDLLAEYLGADENGRQQALFNFVVQNP